MIIKKLDTVNLSKQARSVKFDKRFFNFEDPEVFKEMTGEEMSKNWKETYGFDFAAAENGNIWPNIRNTICALLL